MAVDSTVRRVVFKGDGVGASFPFAFKVFEASDVGVVIDGADITYGVDFSVTLNADQENNPGGVVVLKSALPVESVLAIVSSVPMTQPMVLTPFDGFNPTTLNESADRGVIISQQIAEKLSRAITTDATDTMTAQELKQKLLSAADSAFIVASQKAEEAKGYAQEAANSAQFAADTAAELPAQTSLRIEEINAAAQAAGDHEIERIRAEGDNELIAAGMGCGEVTWTLSDPVASGAEITIPGGIKYLVGRKHLRLSWNGCVLYRGQNFDEVGQDDAFSTTIKLLFDAQEGDELSAWVGALGKGEIADAVNIANQALDSVSALSQRVVYKDEQAAS